MYTTKVILKSTRLHPFVQHYTVLNVWSPSRNINFLQKCKDCLNSLMKGSQVEQKLCDVSESCCSARAPFEEAGIAHELPPTVATQQQSTSVIVIGAGMAGLSTANHLQENGVTNVTVLEATDRPGGRIHSRWFYDSIIELGPPIDKDPAVHPILKTVVEDGFTSYQLNNVDQSKGLLMRSDGSVIPYPIAFDVYQKFKQIWHEVHEIEKEQSGNGKQSPLTLMGSRIQQEVRMFPSKYQNDAERVFHGLTSLTLSKSNHDTSFITSNSFGDYLQIPGSDVQVPLGHFGEIDTLYKAIPKDNVIFNKNVTKIRWGGVADSFPRAIVTCEDGESFQADYVIITVPLGVLKALADTLFCPGLPANKLNAVLKIPMGFTNKVFLEFPETEPFWKWKKDFHKISYDAKKMQCKKGWLKGVTSIEPLRGSFHVICVTVDGLEAQCMESLSDNDIICGVLSLLQETSHNKDIPDPVTIKRTSWSSDPNFYGAYGDLKPKVSSKDVYDLATPLPEQSELCDPVLLFAGEATCPVHFGTVRGAKNSGIREAERLLQLLRLQNERDQLGQILEKGCGF